MYRKIFAAYVAGLTWLVLASGCKRESTPPPVAIQPPPSAPASSTAPAPSGLTATQDSILLDPSAGGVGHATIFFGLGSVTLRACGLDGTTCVFEYTEEVEGGYTTYRLRVPTTSAPIWVKRDRDEATKTGFVRVSDIRTSFDPDRGEPVVTGNLHNGHRDVLGTHPSP